MTLLNRTPDEALKHQLESYSEMDKEFWTFRGKAAREHAHAYFQYPAMMVPGIQGQLIQAVCEVEPGTKSIFDPFVGSGTVLTEAMMQGHNFTGQDINPLAVLVCLAKRGPFHDKVIRDKINALIKVINEDQSLQIEADFPGLNKWFGHEIAIELSRIRRAIRNEEELWCRRFFWVALAETVRLTSNSRTSTFKLHIRTKDEIERRNVSPINIFGEKVLRNMRNLVRQKELLQERNLLEEEYYQGRIEIRLGDSANKYPNHNHTILHDLLVTSPPYGDNTSTVPYGQYSYLPLQWIDLRDIDEDIDESCLATTHEIDSRSLGGSLINALEDTAELHHLSKSFKQIIEDLKDEPRDRRLRVAAFCRDLNCCLDPILAALKPNAYMIWTVGNRRVANQAVPVDQILSELLRIRGIKLITRLQRSIPTKRMAVKNRTAVTMGAEAILIMRKGET